MVQSLTIMKCLSTLTLWMTVCNLVIAGTLPMTKVADTAFSARKDHWVGYNTHQFNYVLNDGTSYTLPIDSYIMWSGHAVDEANDVWVSEDALNWQMVGGKNPGANSSHPDQSYTFHVGQAECQDFVTDRLYVTGGENGKNTLNLGYVSADGGSTWTGFTMAFNRSYSNCVVDSRSRIYVMNGIKAYNRPPPGTDRQPNNEVWVSSNYGSTWTQLNNASYSQRMASSVAISIKKGPRENTDIIYVVGGLSLNPDGTELGMNDVWVSTSSGNSWIRATAAAQWPHHIDTTLVVSRQGMLMLVGGRNVDWGESSDLWGSMDGGINWGKLTPSSNQYTGRIFPAAMFTPDGHFFVTGGEYNGKVLKDTFKSNDSLEADLPRTAVLLGLNADIWRPSRLCLGWLPCAAPLQASRVGNGPFSTRAHAGSVLTRRAFTLRVYDNSTGNYTTKVFPKASYIIAGGMNTPGDNDVWISTDFSSNSWYLIGGRSTQSNGRVVNAEKPNESFVLHDGQAICSNYVGDKWLAAGGDTNNGPTDVTYSSMDSGQTWTLNNGTKFTHRSWTTCAYDKQDKIYVVGGILDYDKQGGDNRDPSNDVWRSTDNGLSWERVVSEGSFVPRGAHAMAIAYAQGADAKTDLIYIAGGFTDIVTRDSLNDVYVSANNGITWVCTTTQAAWVKRADLAMTASAAGVLIVSGGRTDGEDVHNEFYVFNDIWASFDGGYNWYLLEESAFSPRRLHSILVTNYGKLVVVAGKGSANNAESLVRDIYRTSVGDFNVPSSLVPLLHADDIPLVKYNPKCAGYFVSLGQPCPGYNPDNPDNPDYPNDPDGGDPDNSGGLSTGAVVGIVILVLVVVIGTCGWSFYSIRVHGELRIPFTNKACNCCNNALKEDQLADDGYALHKGTGKLKNSLNGSLHHRLIDE